MRLPIVLLLACALLTACAEQKLEEQPAERWVVQELGTRAEFQDVFFLDEQRGWILGGGIQIEGGILGTTTDGGRTWKFDSGITRPSHRATSFHLNAVWFLNERTGFIAGDGLQMLRTRDGGKHWHKISTGEVWAHLHDLTFVDDTHGWAIGNGGLMRTVDGGETWRRPKAPDSEDESPGDVRGRALSFVDPQRGWLVGRHGLIRYTYDGGESWEYQEESASEKSHLWGVDFVNYRQGWAVGEEGTILHTADGGKSWQRQKSGVPHDLTDVGFLDERRGWIVGFWRSDGTSVVLRTADGGETWSEQARVDAEAMLSLHVLDDRHAWAVGVQQRRGPDDGSQKLLRYEVVEEE